MTFVRQNTKDVRQNIVILAEVPFLFSVRLQWSRPVSRGPCDLEIEVHDHFRWEPLRRRVVPHSTCLNFQVHVTRKHIDVLPHTIVDLTRCVTKGVLISFDFFLNVYSSIYYILKIILKAD